MPYRWPALKRVSRRLTHLELNRRAGWELRGVFPGKGEVNLARRENGTRITGFEEIDIEDAHDPDTVAEMNRAFAAIWQIGWDSLRATSDAHMRAQGSD